MKPHPLYLILLVLLLFSHLISAQNANPIAAKSSFTEKALNYNGFLKNIGQVRSLENKAVESVFYYGQIGNQTLYITDKGISFVFCNVKELVKKVIPLPVHEKYKADTMYSPRYEIERIDLNLVNGKIKKENIETEQAADKSMFNFYYDTYTPAKANLQLQQILIVKNVYPGIDWKLYIKTDNGAPTFKYDFIIYPGADASVIRLHYSDNANLARADSGGLATRTKMGEVHEGSPLSYLAETKTAIPVSFSAKKNDVRFKIPAYNKGLTLVIDPDVYWATYIEPIWSTTQYHYITGSDIRTDAAGNIFVQLSAKASTPFPTVDPGNGAYYRDFVATPNGAMILMKFKPTGQLIWCTYFGGSEESGGNRMAIDNAGNVCAMGRFTFNRTAVPLLNNGGFYDPVPKTHFITKFDNNGKLTWSSFYADASTGVQDMTSDNSGNFYVVGWTNVYAFPTVNPGNGAYCVTAPQYGSAYTYFISQFNASNQLVWSTRIEGNEDDDLGVRVHVDNRGNIYMAGAGRSSFYPFHDAGGYFTTNGQITLIRFNAQRQINWLTNYPGSFPYKDIATDDSCNLYLVSGRKMVKFDTATHLIWEKEITTTQAYFLKDIEYDRPNHKLQVLGIMNDSYYGFPTQNTNCNSSFFNNGIPAYNATGPIFLTYDADGTFSYLSLTDWTYEYYDDSEMAADSSGNLVYLFNDIRNSTNYPNTSLTNPGNGAYYNPSSWFNGMASFLLKLQPTSLTIIPQVTAPPNCSCTGSITLNIQCGTAPFKYQWSTGDISPGLLNVCPGKYQVRVTDNNNISKTLNFDIPQPPGSVTAIATNSIPENCTQHNGSIAVLSVTGGQSPYTFSLNGGNYTSNTLFPGLDSGMQVIKIKDANGCTLSDTSYTGWIKGPTQLFYHTNDSRCDIDDGKLFIDSLHGGIGPYTYSINGQLPVSAPFFQSLGPNIYHIAAFDTAGCSITMDIPVKRAMPPSNVSFITTPDHCNQSIGTLQVTSVSGGIRPYQYSIDSISFANSTPINNIATGQYFLYVSDSNHCIYKSAPIKIDEIGSPSALYYEVKDAVCGAITGNILVDSAKNGSAPYTYAIDAGAYGINTVFPGITPGAHALKVNDAYGCSYSDSFNIKYVHSPVVELSPKDTTVCYNQPVKFRVLVDASEVQGITWSIPGSGYTASVNASDNMEVFVTVTDNNHCTLQDSALVKVKACNPPETCVVIPTAFSPNNDGYNDRIGPIANGCRINNLRFSIYNRFGELVFVTSAIDNKWDGMYKGKQQPAGAYVYYCVYTGADNVSRVIKGTILLIH